MSDDVKPQDREHHDLLWGVGCATEILMGAGVVDVCSSERCLQWSGGVIEKSLLKQFKRRVGKGINCL